ncbi:MAG: N-acetyltransferase [Dyadobacter sp.]|uniref:N-acetyltransferase n=1 Tax=Dyadobacter sp. TaxID=1914288 RepID=UPI001B083E83|nr:N-acetyltransferase [Dyadobacter sp.]MBO9613112.1 N-acetyltransferase [Dyadobacter sp.]
MGYYLEDKLTGERLPAVISRLSRKEVMLVGKKQFHFDWKTEALYEVYGLKLVRSREILGLISLDYQASNRAIEIRLIANASEHTGRRKRYERIAGSLIAFACSKSVEAGFGGFVYLRPKTKIIDHYRSEYGFKYTGFSMIIEGSNSEILINRYHEDTN